MLCILNQSVVLYLCKRSTGKSLYYTAHHETTRIQYRKREVINLNYHFLKDINRHAIFSILYYIPCI